MMWYKHAIWKQCAIVSHAVLAGAALLSCQSLTLFIDVYWACVLCTSTIIQFIAAEHSPFGHLNADQWIRLEKHRALWMLWILGLWHIFRGSAFMFTFFSIILALLTFVKVPQHLCFLFVALIHICSFPGYITFVWCLWAYALFHIKRCNEFLIGKSLANHAMRILHFSKSICIVCEAICIWHVRCLHRFPHSMRWTPVIVSTIAIAVAIMYADRYIAKTKVTHNAIIHKLGHGIAPSIVTARKCPVCVKCISALDMEASFGD